MVMCCCAGVSCAVTCGVFVAFTALGLSLLALITPHWLENNGYAEHPQFEKLGLWEMCFRDFRNRHSFMERQITGCRWVYDPRLADIDYFIRPRFYVITQILYSGTVLFAIFTVLLAVISMFCVASRRESRVLIVTAVFSAFSAFSATAAITVFALFGSSPDWMPDWRNNSLSWSFIAAGIAVCLQYISLLIFCVKARRVAKFYSFSRPVSHYGYHLTSTV